MKNFIDKASGSNHPTLIAKDFTNDIQSIIKMMTDTYPLLTERAIKNRFTRIINKLKSSQLQDDEIDTEISE